MPDGHWNDDLAWSRTTPWGGGFDIPPWANWGIDPTGTISFYNGVLPTGWLSLDPSFAITGIAIPEPSVIILIVSSIVGFCWRKRQGK